MIRNLLSLAALLIGSAFLLFAGGMNSLILPVRGQAEGFTAANEEEFSAAPKYEADPKQDI
ncbi:MAG: hypothetical protein ACJAZ1_003411 [Yoonia sp.]|jgi:hypothetical protein